MDIGIIGYGNIGRSLLRLIGDDPALGRVRPRLLTRRPVSDAGVPCFQDIDAFLAGGLALVLECAGHGAVRAHVGACLRAGCDTIVASVGALTDPGLAARLDAAARTGSARLVLPAGALGGVDLLSALRAGGIDTVTYEGRKPPRAWRGSPVETALDLETLRDTTVFFDGSAREAAGTYPKNANVAATVALAGVGLDATRVRLIADPSASGNTHRVNVVAGGADFTIEVTGKPSPDNPRTSVTTAYSLLREIRNRLGPVVI